MYFVAKPNEEAKAFIQAAGLTDETQMKAIGTLVFDLKNYRIWDKMKALYPMVGGTSGSHKFNLKDPRDADDAFRIRFEGGWDHTSTGAKPNGIDGYINTNLKPFSHLNEYDIHVSYYNRTQSSGNYIDFGIIISPSATNLWGEIWRVIGGTNRTSNTIYAPLLTYNHTSTPNIQNYYIWNVENVNKRNIFINNSKFIETTSTTLNALPDRNFYFAAVNIDNTAAGFTDRECAFASIGNGLTDTEAANFYTAVQRFQTTLGRQV